MDFARCKEGHNKKNLTVPNKKNFPYGKARLALRTGILHDLGEGQSDPIANTRLLK